MKYPKLRMQGIMSGKRILSFVEYLEIVDTKSKLKSVTFFNIAETTKATKMKDEIEGIVYKYKQGNEKGLETINDLDDIDIEIARIKGRWNEKINIGGICYWNTEDY